MHNTYICTYVCTAACSNFKLSLMVPKMAVFGNIVASPMIKK